MGVFFEAMLDKTSMEKCILIYIHKEYLAKTSLPLKTLKEVSLIYRETGGDTVLCGFLYRSRII